MTVTQLKNINTLQEKPLISSLFEKKKSRNPNMSQYKTKQNKTNKQKKQPKKEKKKKKL